jgi:hypothetical protein
MKFIPEDRRAEEAEPLITTTLIISFFDYTSDSIYWRITQRLAAKTFTVMMVLLSFLLI